MVENAATVGEVALDRLEEIKGEYDFVGDVRGKGLHLGVELVEDRETKEPAVEAAKAVRSGAHREGLLVSRCGTLGNVIRLSPPLTVTPEGMSEMLNRLERAIASVSKERKSVA